VRRFQILIVSAVKVYKQGRINGVLGVLQHPRPQFLRTRS